MNEINPLISVIVPIYNVDKYVRKCLDSLKNQTMKQIEVICIDDGSTDDSGKIANEYASDEWPRFRVIHTENKGLSAARNRGIDEARADWLMFVDSDDWVDREFCEIPFEAALMNKAELVCFRYYRVTKSGKVKSPKRIDRFEGIVKHEAAIDDIGETPVWNKMYKKYLFDNIRYPEGHFYEELATTHKLIYKADRILKIPHYLYYYRKRQGSITNSSIAIDDLLYMSKQRYDDLLKLGYPKEKAFPQLLTFALRYCGKANKDSNRYREAQNIVKEGVSVHLSGKDQIKKWLFVFNSSLYRCVYRLAIHAKGED